MYYVINKIYILLFIYVLTLIVVFSDNVVFSIYSAVHSKIHFSYVNQTRLIFFIKLRVFK